MQINWSIARICLLVLVFLGILALSVLVSENSIAENNQDVICAVYITGVGCSNCAFTDPVLLTEFTARYPNLVIIEYETYRLSLYNKEIKDAYFRTYLSERNPGIPFLILKKELFALGRFEVLKAETLIESLSCNAYPLPDGSAVDFEELDITALAGKLNIWTKNRVLISGKGGDNRLLKKILTERDILFALKNVEFEKVDPVPVFISRGEIIFEHAIKIGDWRLQWSGEPMKISQSQFALIGSSIFWMLIVFVFLGGLFFLYRFRKIEEGPPTALELNRKRRDCIVVAIVMIALFAFFILAGNITPDCLECCGYNMPLWVFTFFIALIDSFNPCNMFVLSCLLVLLISNSGSKRRLYTIGFSFIFMVFVIYFLFMTAWLNVFKFISFMTPLRITIAIVALIAGLVNCKELLFFRKGISLMIQEEHKRPLFRKIEAMKGVIKNGSFPILISSSIGLAAFASLIELPCTAGFPIIYTGILSGRILRSTLGYYGYLFLYNLVYVIPLVVIITIFIYTFRARYITQRQIQVMKFVGGIIMILLGIILLVNPGLIGLGLGLG